jgi:hypothetical protein
MSSPVQQVGGDAPVLRRAAVDLPVTTQHGASRAPGAAPPAARSTHLDGWAGVRRALLFVSLLIAGVAALDVVITAGLRQIRTGGFGATNRLVNGGINADIVITGSSRALVHYDPRVIEATTGLRTYNLGRNGSQTDMQLAVLKTYLQHNTRPRLLIHNLDLYSFVTSHEIYDPAQYLPYLDQPAIYAGVRRVYPDAWKWKYLPLYGYIVADMRFTWIAGLKRLVGLEPAESHFNGFVPRHLSWTGEFDAFVRQNPAGADTPVEPAGVRDVEEILELCRAHGIPALLVYSPEYAGIHPLQRNREEIFARFAAISDRYGVPLLDYSGSEISRHQRYFYNSQHLNADGARVFSFDLGGRLAGLQTSRATAAVEQDSTAHAPFSSN